jgi:hypothetical protein
MKKVIYYINLTNGIEMIDKLELRDYRFMRIQSTACEQKRWDFILQDLDYDFLMNLALGNPVVVYDLSSKKYMPRSIYQGIPWIKYALNRVWFKKETEVYVKSNNVTDYFKNIYNGLDKKTLVKLKYFRKFLFTSKLNLYAYSTKTDNDGNFEYFRKVLKF